MDEIITQELAEQKISLTTKRQQLIQRYENGYMKKPEDTSRITKLQQIQFGALKSDIDISFEYDII